MRQQPRQERSRQSVSRVLEAANDEFAEHGFHAAQIIRIAQRADVAVGSMYRYFPDKDALAKAITDEYLAAVGDGYGPILNTIVDQDTTLAALHQLIAVAADLQRRHAGYYRLTNDVRPDDKSWPGHRVRQTLVAQFSSTLRNIGAEVIGAATLEQVVEFAIEIVRRTLADTPGDETLRKQHIAELDHMISSYITERVCFPLTS